MVVTEKRYRVQMEIAGWPITLAGTRQGIAEVTLGAHSGGQSPETPPWADEAKRQLAEYFASRRRELDLPFHPPRGTPFQERVWKACREIPYGRVSSYRALACRIGSPGAPRAVGQALGNNPLPLIIPCHRVVRADGRPGGFSAGTHWKEKLLLLENARPEFWSWNNEIR
ncbi:MAG TPA: methylated-DNA--[protein]-cysteine S-methyltransferase [Firmicutes bacterium]|mgnify:CR=1 FL=1|nr:methylated-DNA--[protein]-cysteine S-methyltransferase [Bacillota bacterium]